MAISEESRHHLYQRLENVLGPEEATVLMQHLPPVGWADVATKRDLDAMEERVGMRFDRVDQHFVDVESRWDERFSGMERRWDERVTAMESRWDERVTAMERQWDERFIAVGQRFDGIEHRLDDFRSLLISLMGVMAVLFAAMAGAIVAAVKI